MSDAANQSVEVELVLSVVIPAFRCAESLLQCVRGLRSAEGGAAVQVVVCDDCSGDTTGQAAAEVADIVVTTTDGPLGPAAARNTGALAARGDILIFMDADVVPAGDAILKIRRCFEAMPELDAVFGSYDAAPAAAGFVSQYRNLQHHYVHHASAGPAVTFWAGCGAIRRAVFMAVGGFDERRYPKPQVEDIELGYRLAAAGKVIRLEPSIQVRHLKRWTLLSMLRTDLLGRAVPWMHLIMERGGLAADGPLNTRLGEKLLTALAGLMTVCVAAWLLTGSVVWLTFAGAIALTIAAANASFLAWLARVRGFGFAFVSMWLRVLFYIVSAAGAGWAVLTHWRQPHFPALQTLQERARNAFA